MKHFEKEMKVDIVNDTEFSASNKIFLAMMVKLKAEGKSKVVHKEPLSKNDIHKFNDSFDLNTPDGLQNNVFVDFMIFFCNRGRENLREIQKSDLIFEENNQYIEMRDMATKNHKGDRLRDDNGSQGGRIYKTGNKLCPFTSLEKYLSVLHPECEFFFQRPKTKVESGPGAYWFDKCPCGKNTLGNKMKKLSTDAKLSR